MSAAPDRPPRADDWRGSDPIVLDNVRLLSEPTTLRAIAISAGTITAIGPAGTLRDSPDAAASGVARSFDLDGRWVTPGLWDRHVHFEQWAIMRARHDLSDATSAAAAATAVRAALDHAAAGPELFVGVGYRDALWPDRPTAALLDERVAEPPVVLISADLHATWLNTAALRRFGFGFGDHQTGVLREQDAFAVQLAITDLPDTVVDQLVASAASAAATRGVVGIVDFELADNGPDWQRRIAAGIRSLRVTCSVWPQRLDEALERGVRTGDPLAGTFGMATMGPLKVIIDGSLNTRTAYCYDAYPETTSHGLLTVAPDELSELLRRARRAGLTAAVHAIGDHAIAIALDAFEDLSTTSAGCSIEHVQLMNAADLPRMARLNLIASVQPAHLLDDRDVADIYWPGRTGGAFALRSLLDAGVALALGSDAPVAPLDPWRAIGAAVHRTRDGRPAWHGEQSIPVEAALAASTVSRLEVGARADLVVLDQNPLTVGADQLATMPVAATMLGGDWTHLTID